MPPRPAPSSLPILLVWGEDDFTVKQRARQVFEEWRKDIGGDDHEIIDASVSNSSDALRALGRLREALQTLPFFGTGKAVWFQSCSFLGDDRTAGSQIVTESLVSLAAELKALPWDNLRLLISSGKLDRRKVFYKTIEKIGSVEAHAGLSSEDKDWAERAEALVEQRLTERKKTIAADALAELVNCVGPNIRLLDSEAEKLALYVGERPRIGVEDVRAVAVKNRQARAFALAEALGERDLPKLLRALEDELWEMKFDKQKSEIGLLYGVISKVRTLILVKELMREGHLKAENEYARFKSQIERVPPQVLAEDRRFNPLAQHPFVLFRAVGQARHYKLEELVRAMELLLDCNRKLVSSDLEERLVLQHALVQIVTPVAASAS